MAIADQINRLNNAKAAIKQSIENKGVDVGDSALLDEYPALIDKIEGSGGSDENNPYQQLYMQRTANETSMNGLFAYTPASTTLNLSMMNTSKVTDMSYMFSECKAEIKNIDGWDTSKLTNADYMFNNFTNNNKYIDLSVLDFSNVTKADGMFEGCDVDNIDIRNLNLNLGKLKDLPFENVSGTVLDLSNYDITGLTSTYYLCHFCKCSTVNLTNWKTTEVTDMKQTFYYGSDIQKIIMPDWDMTNTTNTSSFFYNCSKLNYIDLSRSNDATIAKIASLVPAQKLATYGQILIPVDSSQANIEALAAKYWKPVGPRIYITSCEIATELDEIKPGKTTKLYYGNATPWYGSDPGIEYVSSNESIATIDGEIITSTGIEGTVEITARIADTQEVISEPKVLSVSGTDSYPNVIKFRSTETNKNNYIRVNNTNIKLSDMNYNSISDVYTYDAGKAITSIRFDGTRTNTYQKMCSELIKINTGNMTTMEDMFSAQQYLTELDLSDFNTSKVTSMKDMFSNCDNLTELDISSFDTSNVTNMYEMFGYCRELMSLDVNNFNTGNVTTMDRMFYGCSKLTSLDLNNFNTGKVSGMSEMFYSCSELTELDIRNFDMSRCSCDYGATSTINSNYRMFQNCNKLHTLRLDNCSKDTVNKIITSYGFPTGNIGQRKIYVNPKNVIGLKAPENWIFVDCETGEEIIEQEIPTTEILVYTTNNQNSNPKIRRQDGEYSGFVRKVEDMGAGYYKIIIGIDDITNPPVHYRFTDCNVNAIEKINIDYLTDMNSTFESSGLTYLDASDWNVSNVQDMGYLFSSNYSLNDLYISGWNTGCVSNMGYMFNNCSSLGTLDLSNFDTRNVNDMSYMFNECNNLYELNLSNFDMTNTYSVDDMFYNCWSLSTLRLDYCSIETVDKIVNSSNFPADNYGTIYCSYDVYSSLTPPGSWTFEVVW